MYNTGDNHHCWFTVVAFLLDTLIHLLDDIQCQILQLYSSDFIFNSWIVHICVSLPCTSLSIDLYIIFKPFLHPFNESHILPGDVLTVFYLVPCLCHFLLRLSYILPMYNIGFTFIHETSLKAITPLSDSFRKLSSSLINCHVLLLSKTSDIYLYRIGLWAFNRLSQSSLLPLHSFYT